MAAPPLGYDLDENRQLIINAHEAEAVRIIFEMFADGHGYTAIIDYLNAHGYKTKRGCIFGKNSLYEILANEKYTGTFVFNKAAANVDGKRNNHACKSNSEMIRVENGCPAIISKGLFEKVQRRKAANKRNAGQYHSKEFYLLTGKVLCGVCGKRMIGNVRYSGRSKTRLATYRCQTHRSVCKNKELNKDHLDAYTAVLLEEKILHPAALKKAVSRINRYIRQYNKDYNANHAEVTAQYSAVLENLNNITVAVEKGILTDSIIKRAEELEAEKAQLETGLQSMQLMQPIEYKDVSYLLTEWKSLKHNTEEFRSFVQQFIKEIRAFPYHFEIVLDVGLGVAAELTEMISMRRGELYEMFESKVRE